MRTFDVQGNDLVPGQVYYNPKRQQYIHVLGRLTGKPGWVKARPALLDEIKAHRQARSTRNKIRKAVQAKPVNLVVNLADVPVYYSEDEG